MNTKWEEATPTPDSLLLCLNTYPKFDNNGFIKTIDSNYTKAKIKRINTFKLDSAFNKENYHYYDPVHFHLWGSWDICSLVRADSSYQITKMLHTENSGVLANNSTRLLNGISFEEYGLPLQRLTETSLGSYIVITNLKISNKWLLKNGYSLIIPILKKIDAILNSKNYFVMQSYSSYEINLVIIGDTLGELSELAFTVRETLVSNLALGDNIQILYGDDNRRSNVFSDSNTIFGARLILNQNEEYEIQKGHDEKLNVNYEFEVKPCQHKQIVNFISDKLSLSHFSKPGKYDVITETENIFSHSLTIAEKLRTDTTTKDSIRKLKTNLLFEHSNTDDAAIHPSPIEYNFDFDKLNTNLKRLKVSKTIRNQILRMYFAFKNQIHDSINLNLFLDIHPFIDYVYQQINLKADQIASFFDDFSKSVDNDMATVAKVENFLKGLIKTFNDSYFLRLVNDHSFLEDLPDFLISHNAQYQTIASIYDNCTKNIASIILSEEDSNKILTTFDDSITEVNAYNLKLSTYVLFEPSLIFSLITKEIINIYINKHFNAHFERTEIFKQNLEKYYKANPDCPSIVLKNNILLYSLDYLYNDYMRLNLFYNENFELYYYSHLSNLIQLPALYDTTGGINRNLVVRELVRVLYLIQSLNTERKTEFMNIVKENPPSREVQSEWEFAFELLEVYFQNSPSFNMIDDDIIKLNLFKIKQNIATIKASEKFKLFKDKLDFIAEVFENDSQTPAFVGRNWNNGNIKESETANPFFFYENKPYFLYDPQGGIFFYNFEKMQEYAIMRNKMMMVLFDEACQMKTKLFEKLPKKNTNEESTSPLAI